MKTPAILAATALSILAAGIARADEATLAAGAGFRRPLAELAQQYAAQSGDSINQIYGHVGQVVAQARESDEISMLCGDKATFANAEGLAFSSWVPLGWGRLVVAYRKGLALDDAKGIEGADFQRIGIPDQANAIYGKAGRQFLERSGRAAAIDPRLIAVATVPQVTGYVTSGEVDAGFVNATDAIGAGDGIGGYVEVAPEFYDPVEVVCGIRTGAESGAVKGFSAYLATDAARATLDKYGLSAP